MEKLEMSGEIWLDKVKPDTNQPRREFDEESLKALAEGIKRQGVINPIDIDENNVIIDGERRWRACKMAGLTKIPYQRTTLKEKLKTDPHFLLKRQLQANLSSQHLKISESRKVIEKLTLTLKSDRKGDRYTGMRKLSNELGVSEATLSLILQLDREGSNNLKEAVEKKGLAFSTAVEISKIPDFEVQDKLIKHTIDDELNRDKVRELVREIETRPEEANEIIETSEVVSPISKQIATDILDTMEQLKKEGKFEQDLGFANFLFMKGIQGALDNGKLYCPKCKKQHGLKWGCCGEELNTTISKLAKKYNGGN